MKCSEENIILSYMVHPGLSIVVHCIPTLHSQCPLLVGPLCSEHTQHSVHTGQIAGEHSVHTGQIAGEHSVHTGQIAGEGVRRSERETERERERERDRERERERERSEWLND